VAVPEQAGQTGQQEQTVQRAKLACCTISNLFGLDSHERRMRELEQLYDRIVKQRQLELQAKVTIFREGMEQVVEFESRLAEALRNCQTPEAEQAVQEWFQITVTQLKEGISARLNVPIGQ
jgi:hypothetical protein